MSTIELPAETKAPHKGPRRLATPQTATIVAYVTGMFMGATDSQIVNVILPTLSRDFHAPIASIQWTVLAYVLALTTCIPLSGWIGDKIGTKRTFCIALAIFTVASALCGQAQNLNELVIARALQGLGAGMLTPVGMSMMWRAYPPEDRARITRIMMIPVVIGPASAPVIGGLLATDLSWRWVFYVNIPIAVCSLIFSATHLEEHRESADATFDLKGFLLAGTGLGLLLYAVSEGPLVGWGQPRVLICGVIAIIELCAFVTLERRLAEKAMLRVSLLRDRLFRACNTASGFGTGSYLGLLFLAPILIQEARHQSALSSGLTTFCASVGSFIGIQTLGRLYRKVGPRRLALTGLIGQGALEAVMGFVGAGTSFWTIRVILFFAGIFAGTQFTACQTAMFTSIDRKDTGHASAITNTVRQTAVALGIATVSTVAASIHSNVFDSFHDAFFACAGISALGTVFAYRLIHDSDAQRSMNPGESPPAMESA